MNTEIEELIRQNSEESLAILSEKELSDAETEFLLAKSQEEEYQWFTGEFLMIYDHFTDRQKELICEKILQNENPADPLFLSDFFDFARFNQIYREDADERARHFCRETKTDNVLIMCALLYLVFVKPDEEADKLCEEIVENPDYYQNVQIIAAAYLYGRSPAEETGDFLRELIAEDDINREVFENFCEEIDNQNEPLFAEMSRNLALLNA